MFEMWDFFRERGVFGKSGRFLREREVFSGEGRLIFRTVFRIIRGIIFRTTSELFQDYFWDFFGLFRTMRNNVYLRRDRK